jgi:predicted RNA-binding Zn-ribbon protein involved in translation (DUF1610 family)
MYDPWRKRWIETGMQWRLGRPPEGWDAVKQLRSIAIPVDPHKFSSDVTSVKHMCPVCGYPELSEPARRAGGGGSYEICHSCGFEFGVSDNDQGFTDEQWRQKWIDDGMRWQSVGRKQPEGWNPVEQLSNLTKQR